MRCAPCVVCVGYYINNMQHIQTIKVCTQFMGLDRGGEWFCNTGITDHERIPLGQGTGVCPLQAQKKPTENGDVEWAIFSELESSETTEYSELHFGVSAETHVIVKQKINKVTIS